MTRKKSNIFSHNLHYRRRSSLTGYHMLRTIYGIEPGESVLINAIGGGVGLFTTQLAVKAGVRVIGTVGTPGKEARALEKPPTVTRWAGASSV